MPQATFGQRHRFKRNLALYLARQGGMSINALADAFLLSRARIGKILDEVEQMQNERNGASDAAIARVA